MTDDWRNYTGEAQASPFPIPVDLSIPEWLIRTGDGAPGGGSVYPIATASSASGRDSEPDALTLWARKKGYKGAIADSDRAGLQALMDEEKQASRVRVKRMLDKKAAKEQGSHMVYKGGRYVLSQHGEETNEEGISSGPDEGAGSGNMVKEF